MSNNYLQFSEVIPSLTNAEEEWLKHQLEGIAVVDGVEHPYQLGESFVELAEAANKIPIEEAQFAGCRAYRNLKGYDCRELGDHVGFQYQFDGDRATRDGWGRHMWLYADEGAEVDLVAHLVQKFLRQFRPTDCWSLTYATTCSRPRVGEFGGGAVFVTARSVSWNNAYDFVAKRRASFAVARQRKTKRKARK